MTILRARLLHQSCVAVVACLLLLLLATPAEANLVSGMLTGSGHTGYRGARASIDNYIPRYSSNGFSCVWPMVLNYAGQGTHAIAQIGWTRGNGTSPPSSVVYFFEYEYSSGSYEYLHQLGNVPSPGSYGTDHLYTVQFISSDNTVVVRIDGVNQAYYYNQYDGRWWTPDAAEWLGEIVDNGDQIAGDRGTNHYCEFTNPSTYWSGSWHLVTPTGGTDGNLVNQPWNGGQSHSQANYLFRTWDNRWTNHD